MSWTVYHACENAPLRAIKDELILAPYVALTTRLMQNFGVAMEGDGEMDGGMPPFLVGADTKYAITVNLVERDTWESCLSGKAVAAHVIALHCVGVAVFCQSQR